MRNCLECGKETHNPKFCSNSCSVTYNNRGIRRHGKSPIACKICGKKTSRGTSKYCSSSCHKIGLREEYIAKWFIGEVGGSTSSGCSEHIRNYLFEKYGNKCQLCGWNKINKLTRKVPLEIHHVDGNYKNNRPENIQLLCPNCHSITSTYKNLNKGKGRENRKKTSR